MSAHFLHELRSTFDACSNRPALAYRGDTITYGALDREARRCAGHLQVLGVEPGDRVVLLTEAKWPLLLGNLAALYAGAVALPLNPRFTREELRFFLKDSAPRAVILGEPQRAILSELAVDLEHPPALVHDATLEQSASGEFRDVSVSADAPCLILYSSGTTGWPKGVVHTNANVASSLRALQAAWQISPDDVVLNVLPLFHIHGLAFATHLTWLAGGCLALEDAFEPQRTLAAIYNATVFMSVPTIYYRLLDDPAFEPAARGWSKPRLFTCGSAPIRAEVLPRLQEILGHPVINRYGMTEAYVITSLPLAGPCPAGSVGKPLAGIELRVTRDDGSAVATGEPGAVSIRGPNLFREYWRKPEATAAAFADGWFDTGDIGCLDESGMLTLVGRRNDLIITSGFNVYPQVVERVVNECPGVRECAVLGLADDKRGERVAVAVVRSDPTLDEARLTAWWSDRLVHYQQPRQILFLEALPRNSMGKVLRREIAALAAPASGGASAP